MTGNFNLEYKALRESVNKYFQEANMDGESQNRPSLY